jgi:hypothetical protein
MALLNISAAARATGKDRTTLHRKMKAGELSATVGPDGSKLLDTSELERVFGPLRATGDATPAATTGVQHAPQQPAPAPDPTAAALVELLRGQLVQSADRERWLREQLEAEQHARRELETRLLAPPTKEPVPEPAPAHKSAWWWLFLVLVPVAAAALGYAAQRWIW